MSCMTKDYLDIPVDGTGGGLRLLVYPQSSGAQGTLTTGIYVGLLALEVADRETKEHAGRVRLEIRSTKAEYRSDYRLNKVLLEDKDVVRAVGEELEEEKRQQELKIHKRGDLLKMHAYKDAIRRTSGAYVLYPGEENRELRGFHEIVPGLGAFSIRPGHWLEDSAHLRLFLVEVKAHLMDRASDREKLSYYEYDVHREANETAVMESMPEAVGENRDFMPDETWVTVAYCKSEEQMEWILSRGLYNMRAGDDRGSIELDKRLMSARYLLLHSDDRVLPLIRLRKKGPKVYTRAQLVRMGYPQYRLADGSVDEKREQQEAGRIYLVFELYKDNSAERELQGYRWSPRLFAGNRRTYSELLTKVLKKAEFYAE